MVDSLVISLFRHGFTVENERKAYIGWTDSPLSEKGRQELQQKYYGDVTTNLIFSSPLRRCMETASIIFPGQQIITIEALKEMHFGAWEGKTYDELQHRATYRNWLTDIFTQPIEAGERYAQFGERIEAGLQQVIRKTIIEREDRIAIITHGGVIRYILHSLFPNEKSFFDWEIPFGEGYELSWNKTSLKEGDDPCTLLAVEPTMVKRIG